MAVRAMPPGPGPTALRALTQIDMRAPPLADTHVMRRSDVHGVPAGGTPGQVLTKTGSADYQTTWLSLATPPPLSATLTDAAGANTLPAAGTESLFADLLQTTRNALKWLIARFDASGNALTATRLAAARQIAVNLANTANNTTFDGSADQTGIRVSGTLPVAQGGTGQTSLANVTVGSAATATSATSATTAATLATARTIATDPTSATASASFNGSTNITLGIAPNLTAGTAASTLPATGTATALTTLLNSARNCLAWLVARFDASGNALAAVKLATARTVQTNLAGTASASFDGQGNITPGVTGTLGIGNGGTGRTDGKAAALATGRTISLSGAVTGSASFDGSADATIATALGAIDTLPVRQLIASGSNAGVFSDHYWNRDGDIELFDVSNWDSDGIVPGAMLSMAGRRIGRLGDPQLPDDAATMAYVDAHAGQGGGGASLAWTRVFMNWYNNLGSAIALPASFNDLKITFFLNPKDEGSAVTTTYFALARRDFLVSGSEMADPLNGNNAVHIKPEMTITADLMDTYYGQPNSPGYSVFAGALYIRTGQIVVSSTQVMCQPVGGTATDTELPGAGRCDRITGLGIWVR